MTKEYTLIVRTREPWRGPWLALQCVQQYKSNSTGEPSREAPDKSYYAASQSCSHCCGCCTGCGGCCSGGSGCGCNSTGEPPLRGERPQLQVVLCGLQPKSASETLPREFRPSDSATAATNDKTVRKNISQAHQKLKYGSESWHPIMLFMATGF